MDINNIRGRAAWCCLLCDCRSVASVLDFSRPMNWKWNWSRNQMDSRWWGVVWWLVHTEYTLSTAVSTLGSSSWLFLRLCHCRYRVGAVGRVRYTQGPQQRYGPGSRRVARHEAGPRWLRCFWYLSSVIYFFPVLHCLLLPANKISCCPYAWLLHLTANCRVLCNLKFKERKSFQVKDILAKL